MKRILLLCLAMSFILISPAVYSQDRTVSGKVSSADDNSALPGVNVLIKGTTTGTVTDADGNYTLTVPPAATTLVFTFIGMQSQEVAINDRATVNVAMVQDVKQLNEIVVTAMGI
jgi:hypothetical protein